MLRVTGLVKSYRDQESLVQAVKDVSLEPASGSFYTLLGPSGCGKSTTLRCIGGLEQPDAGRIELGGEVIYSSAEGVNVPSHRRGVGMVFQSYAIWPHMNVFDNVAFPLVHGRSRLPSKLVRDKVLCPEPRQARRPGEPAGAVPERRPAAAGGAGARPGL